MGNIEIYNNTIYGVENTGIKVDSVPTPYTVTIKNNIVYGSVALYVYSSIADNLLLLDYNCYYASSGTLVNFKGVNYTSDTFSDYQITTKQDRNSISKDPQFTDIGKQDYCLKPTSPCIDAGTDIHLSIDFAGTPIPKGAGVDIGAFEYEKVAVPQKLRSISTP